MIEEYVYKHKDGTIERLNIPYGLNLPDGVELIGVASNGVERDPRKLEAKRSNMDVMDVFKAMWRVID